jgi:FkbM family methyltransferase
MLTSRRRTASRETMSTSECVHAPWPSWRPVLRSCAHSPTAAALVGGLDADLAWILPKIDKAGAFRLGKLQRSQASELIAGLHRWHDKQHSQQHSQQQQQQQRRPRGTLREACRHAAISCLWPQLQCALANSNAQQQQDLLLLPALLDLVGPVPGTFVELGAYDGVQLSNTYMLERCFNFTGLLIEANPTNFEKMRSSSGRSRSRMVHSAVCGDAPEGRPGTVHMTVDGANVARQVLPESDAGGNQTRRVEPGGTAPRGRMRAAPRTAEVPCAPLQALMERHGFQGGADFLSLDVEGAEDLVLRTVSPAAFKYIMVETELDVSNRRTISAVDQRIRGAGLVRARELTGIQYNTVYRSPHVGLGRG